MKRKILFIRFCFYLGAAIDLLAIVPLLLPEAAKTMLGLTDFNPAQDYLYASRIGASLMAGWTLLLIWGSFKPLERRGILLLTIFPVLFGLVISSVIAVYTGFVNIGSMLPLWIIYAIIIPLYAYAYIKAQKIATSENKK